MKVDGNWFNVRTVKPIPKLLENKEEREVLRKIKNKKFTY